MSEWKRVKIGEICTIEKGITGLAKALPGDYPLVTTGAKRKTSRDYQFNAKAVCIPLVSSTGHGKKTLNYVHYQEGKFALGSILSAVVPRDETILDARYLHVYLQKNKDRVLVPLMRGAANVSLSVTAISNIEVPLPSLVEQKKILGKIDSISNEHEDFLNESDVQIDLFGKLRQAVLQEAVEGKLTVEWRKKNPDLVSGENHASKLLEKIKAEKERLNKEGRIKKSKPLSPITDDEKPFDLPEGWVWCRLGEISQIFAGYSFNSYDFRTGNGAKCIKITNAGVKEIVETNERLPESFINKYPEFLVKEGDLIVALTRPYIALGLKVSKCPGAYNNALLNQRVAAIRQTYSVNFEFVYLFMISDFVLNGYKEKFEKANLQPNLKMNDLTELKIPLPTLAEQQAIVERVDKLMVMTDELEKQVAERKSQSQLLMQSVLREAFAGNK
ncbi:MAG: restriction endonuclease subunit S [Candidatus Desantisbacteria bacterium]